MRHRKNEKSKRPISFSKAYGTISDVAPPFLQANDSSPQKTNSPFNTSNGGVHKAKVGSPANFKSSLLIADYGDSDSEDDGEGGTEVHNSPNARSPMVMSLALEAKKENFRFGTTMSLSSLATRRQKEVKTSKKDATDHAFRESGLSTLDEQLEEVRLARREEEQLMSYSASRMSGVLDNSMDEEEEQTITAVLLQKRTISRRMEPAQSRVSSPKRSSLPLHRSPVRSRTRTPREQNKSERMVFASKSFIPQVVIEDVEEEVEKEEANEVGLQRATVPMDQPSSIRREPSTSYRSKSGTSLQNSESPTSRLNRILLQRSRRLRKLEEQKVEGNMEAEKEDGRDNGGDEKEEGDDKVEERSLPRETPGNMNDRSDDKTTNPFPFRPAPEPPSKKLEKSPNHSPQLHATSKLRDTINRLEMLEVGRDWHRTVHKSAQEQHRNNLDSSSFRNNTQTLLQNADNSNHGTNDSFNNDRGNRSDLEDEFFERNSLNGDAKSGWREELTPPQSGRTERKKAEHSSSTANDREKAKLDNYDDLDEESIFRSFIRRISPARNRTNHSPLNSSGGSHSKRSMSGSPSPGLRSLIRHAMQSDKESPNIGNSWKMPVERYSKYRVQMSLEEDEDNCIVSQHGNIVHNNQQRNEHQNGHTYFHDPSHLYAESGAAAQNLRVPQTSLRKLPPLPLDTISPSNQNQAHADQPSTARSRPKVPFREREPPSAERYRSLQSDPGHTALVAPALSSVTSLQSELIVHLSDKSSLMKLFEESDDKHVIQGDFEFCLKENPMYAEMLSSADSLRHTFSTQGEVYFKNTARGKAHKRLFFVDPAGETLQWCEVRDKNRRKARKVALREVTSIVQFQISAQEAKKYRIVSNDDAPVSCLVVEISNGKGRTKNLELAAAIPMDRMANLAVITALGAIKSQQGAATQLQ